MQKIGVIGAMPSELADIQAAFPDAVCETVGGYPFYTAQTAGKQLIFACCGIAKVNAALCAQVMLDHYGVEAIINTGIAGGMQNAVHVCDIVISNEVLFHDVDPHFLKDYPPYESVYAADAGLIACAKAVCDAEGQTWHAGRIISGDAFITSSTVKAELVNRFNPLAVDMESAAIGQCCFRNDLPFVSVRCISDNADDAGVMSFDTFEKIAAKRVAELVLAMAAQL